VKCPGNISCLVEKEQSCFGRLDLAPFKKQCPNYKKCQVHIQQLKVFDYFTALHFDEGQLTPEAVSLLLHRQI
jgi:hypothetical protein